MATAQSSPPQPALPNVPQQPRVTSSEPALFGGESETSRANLIREISTLPPPQQGGDQGWPP